MKQLRLLPIALFTFFSLCGIQKITAQIGTPITVETSTDNQNWTPGQIITPPQGGKTEKILYVKANIGDGEFQQVSSTVIIIFQKVVGGTTVDYGDLFSYAPAEDKFSDDGKTFTRTFYLSDEVSVLSGTMPDLLYADDVAPRVSGLKDKDGTNCIATTGDVFHIHLRQINISNIASTLTKIDIDNTVAVVDAHVVNKAVAAVGSFSITVTYASAMDPSIAPTITFDKPTEITGITQTGGAWSAGNTVYTFSYTVAENTTDNTVVNYTIAGGMNPAGDTPGATETYKILVDYVAPRITSIRFYQGQNDGSPATVINHANDPSDPNDSYSLRVTYNEEMSTGAGDMFLPDHDKVPLFTVKLEKQSPDDPDISHIDPAAVFGFTDAYPAWANKSYISYVKVTKPENFIANVTIQVTCTTGRCAYDLAGNPMELSGVPGEQANGELTGLTIDLTERNYTASMDPHPIATGTEFATLTLRFGSKMDMTIAPKVEFDNGGPDINTIITGIQEQEWKDNRTYSITYNIAENPGKVIPGIGVTVSDAKTSTGSPLESGSETVNNVFGIDFNSASCQIFVAFDPASPARVVRDEIEHVNTTQVTFTLHYSKTMDPAFLPKMQFNGGDEIAKAFLTANSTAGGWNPERTEYVITYTIPTLSDAEADDPALLGEVSVSATGGVDQASGSPQIAGKLATGTGPFILDMQHIGVTGSHSIAGTVMCLEDTLRVTFAFNQPMSSSNAQFMHTFGTPPDPEEEGFLQFIRTEWLDNQTAVAIYKVDGTKAYNNNVGFRIPQQQQAQALVNQYGRTYYETSATNGLNNIQIAANPPVINNPSWAPVTCYNGNDGAVSINVSGGAGVINYDLLRNGTLLPPSEYTTGAGGAFSGLYPGRYDVKAAGSTDGCYALFNITLDNPERMQFAASVVHHWEKTERTGEHTGKITMTATGGDAPYTYHCAECPVTSQSDSIFTSLSTLDAFNVASDEKQFTVYASDNKNCLSEDTTLIIKDYRTPTLFTPNGDGKNDFFLEGRKVEIYDRTGTLIFTGDNGWDGTVKGKTGRPAVYYYVATFPDGHVKKGAIQLYKN
ncbi:MAG: gliding motility-associated C-terminal domain-containing protein [Bacteroidales bacterium]|nr:gliding motility-associated C-terminal domain-containing protein [Bacteroidales bacterium]